MKNVFVLRMKWNPNETYTRDRYTDYT